MDGPIINYGRFIRIHANSIVLWRLLPDKRHSRSGRELNVCDLIGIGTPAHIAGDDVAVAENPLDNRDMPQATGALHSWLQIDDGTHNGRTGDMPAKLIGAVCPLPGVGLRVP